MSVVRVCFLGTPDFAVTCLKALLEDEHYLVVGVVTQPDRPSGRKLQLTPSPVKELALKNNIAVITPENLKKEPHHLEVIKSWKAEVAVVVAFGQILDENFLSAFQFGAVNVHGSLLPLWRGAAPIQRSIEAGDTETGVALQKMVKRLDAGDVIGIRKLNITEEMDAQFLYLRLAELGSELLRVELMDYIRGNLLPVPQDESRVTFAKKIDKSESQINWKSAANCIHNKIRAFTMGPGTYTIYNGKKIKIHKTKLLDLKATAEPGTLFINEKNELCVNCESGVLKIIELQPESKNKMKAENFIQAYFDKKNSKFEYLEQMENYDQK